MGTQNVISLQECAVFQQHNLVLSDINLEIPAGSFHYLIGKTGSGKSTFLKTLYAELPLERGKATVAGFPLQTLKRNEIPFLRRKLGIVFQDFQLLNDRSVADNLAFVLKATEWTENEKIEQRIREVLTLVGLETKGFKHPNELSGGEQQRVVIARALLNKPDCILADEPTGNLDPSTSDEIIHLLHTITQTGTAVLMATHDYRIIEKFPAKVLSCENGHILVKNENRLSQ